ncbi:hypothetical protein STEG23_018728 [Scotinomys teguina]
MRFPFSALLGFRRVGPGASGCYEGALPCGTSPAPPSKQPDFLQRRAPERAEGGEDDPARVQALSRTFMIGLGMRIRGLGRKGRALNGRFSPTLPWGAA